VFLYFRILINGLHGFLFLFQDSFGISSKAVLLASFIGLDDNAVQFDRLKANLLFLGDEQHDAQIFP
jgi:hypothetical protein